MAMPYEYRSIYLDEPIVEGRAIDVFMPRDVTREVAVFFVHGGGWVGGSRTGAHKLMRGLNAHGYVCGSTDYRLGGTKAADQLTDVRHGYDLFLRTLEELGRPLRVNVHGGSAGAHLGALLAMTTPGQCDEPIAFSEYTMRDGWVRPIGMTLTGLPTTMEPWDDIFPGAWQAMIAAVGVPYQGHEEVYRKLSPIEFVSALTPPALLLEADKDHLFPLDLAVDFVEKVASQGVRADVKVYTRSEHGFFYDLAPRRQQKEAFVDLLAFLTSLG